MNAQNPSASPAVSDAVLKKFGVTRAEYNQFQAGLGGGAGQGYDPFALQGKAETGVLYIGQSQAQPAVMGRSPFDAANLAAGAGTTVQFQLPGLKYTRSILLQGLNLHNGYTAEIVTSDPQKQWPAGISSNQIKKVGIGVQIHDPTGKVVYTRWLDLADKNSIFGYGGDRNSITEPSALEAGGFKSTGQGPDAVIKMNPDEIVKSAATRKAGVPSKALTGSIEDQLMLLYKTPKDQLTSYKHELWAAGYYGNVTLDQVDMTIISSQDIQAFGSLMSAAAAYYKADPQHPVTWQSLLHKQAQSGAVNAKNQKHISVPDPASVIQEANATATKVIGHAPSPQDIQAIMGMVQQGEQKRYDQSIQIGQPGLVQSVDPAADIEQYFRQKYPNESQAMDWQDRAQVWDDMLKSPPTPESNIVRPNG
jgi:hypothetical protein